MIFITIDAVSFSTHRNLISSQPIQFQPLVQFFLREIRSGAMINAWNVERYYDILRGPRLIQFLVSNLPAKDRLFSPKSSIENLATRLIVRRDYLVDDTRLGGLSLRFSLGWRRLRGNLRLSTRGNRAVSFFDSTRNENSRSDICFTWFCLKLLLLSMLQTIMNVCGKFNE